MANLTAKQQDALNLKTGRRFYAVTIIVTFFLCVVFYSWHLLNWVGALIALLIGLCAGFFVAMLTAMLGDPPDDEEFWSIPVRIINDKPKKRKGR